MSADYVRLSDGTTWPSPNLDPDGGLGWRLTHCDPPSRGDCLAAAAVVHAYTYLVTQTTQRRRGMIVRELRAAASAEEGER